MRDSYENVMIHLYTDVSAAVIVIMDNVIDLAVCEGIPSYIDLFFLTAAFI